MFKEKEKTFDIKECSINIRFQLKLLYDLFIMNN